MPQFEDFLHIPTDAPDYSGYTNLFQNVLKGYQMAAAPAVMKEEMQAKKFANQLAAYQASPENLALDRQLKEAQIAQMTTPKQRSMNENEQLYADYMNAPEGSPEKAFYKALMDKKTTQSQGEVIYDSNGNPIVQRGGVAGMPALSRGQSYYYKTDDKGMPVLDEKGEKIPEGILVPTTEKEAEEDKGRYMMSYLQPGMNKILSHYSGKGSNERFMSDVNAAASGDEEAKARLIDLATAEKLVTPLTVKEQKTLGASGTLGMFKALQNSMAKSDIYPALKTLSTYKLPSDVYEKAGDNWLNLITKSTEEANNRVPAFRKRPFNVESNIIPSGAPSESSVFSDWQKLPDTRMVTITDDKGNSKNVTVAEAKKLGAM